MTRFSLLTALSILVVLSLAVAGNAGTLIYDSTPQASNGADPISSFGPLYDSFSTGVNSGAISSLSFVLASFDEGDGTNISVGLYSDSSISPGSLIASLGTIGDASLTSTSSLVNLTPVSSPTLNAGTRYWIGLTQPDGDAYWSYTTDTSGIGVNGEYFANSGGEGGDPVYPNNPDGGYQMAVELGSSVPEPSTVGLCALALLGLAARRLRRRRTS